MRAFALCWDLGDSGVGASTGRFADPEDSPDTTSGGMASPAERSKSRRYFEALRESSSEASLSDPQGPPAGEQVQTTDRPRRAAVRLGGGAVPDSAASAAGCYLEPPGSARREAVPALAAFHAVDVVLLERSAVRARPRGFMVRGFGQWLLRRVSVRHRDVGRGGWAALRSKSRPSHPVGADHSNDAEGTQRRLGRMAQYRSDVWSVSVRCAPMAGQLRSKLEYRGCVGTNDPCVASMQRCQPALATQGREP